MEYPQYTRPADYRGMKVPKVLTGGNHADIVAWRREQSLQITRRSRPDLLETAPLDENDRAILAQLEAAGVRVTAWLSREIDFIVAALNGTGAWLAHKTQENISGRVEARDDASDR